VRIHCRFNSLAPLVADLISADYPYLRQITECAADLVVGSLERRFLRRMSHGLRLYIPLPYFRENGSSRLINRVTIANRRLTEIPHIRTPMTLSRGANVRQLDGRLTSLQPRVE
jgi:hypothetical protein